jgi:hypothetical protein
MVTAQREAVLTEGSESAGTRISQEVSAKFRLVLFNTRMVDALYGGR